MNWQQLTNLKCGYKSYIKVSKSIYIYIHQYKVNKMSVFYSKLFQDIQIYLHSPCRV